jgi:hypothetical protein
MAVKDTGLCRIGPSITMEYAQDSRCFQSVAECQFGIVAIAVQPKVHGDFASH